MSRWDPELRQLIPKNASDRYVSEHLRRKTAKLCRVKDVGLPADTQSLKAGVRRLLPEDTAAEERNLQRVLEDGGQALGFARLGHSAVERYAEAHEALTSWLSAGYAASMDYLTDAASRIDPRTLLPEARTIIVAALRYGGPHESPGLYPLKRSAGGKILTGSVAAYAKGEDYHLVVKRKLYQLAQRLTNAAKVPVLARAAVDTAPLLEREAARRSGVAFTGKNTLSIIPGLGSFFVLGELLVDLEIKATPKLLAEGCGQCTRCLDACPTGAFVRPYVLDARRCISYLTIEHRGVIERELRQLMGSHIFGCDICQTVCPYNAKPKPDAGALEELERFRAPDLMRVLLMKSSEYRRWVRGTALVRVSRIRLARNAAIALGNTNRKEALPALVSALQTHDHPLVRGHAAWAVGNIDAECDSTTLALKHAAEQDTDAWVREEARDALHRRLNPARRG